MNPENNEETEETEATTFSELGISAQLVEALTLDAIVTPTPVQRQVIPIMLGESDLIATAPTGTGKTLAYVLPLILKLDPDKRENQALILAPTHEIAMQIEHVVSKLLKQASHGLRVQSIIGQVNIKRQIEKLKERPALIVGTTGRILELIKLKKITAHTIKTIVLDEADSLLDHNNSEIVKALIKTTMRDRRLVLFSANMPSKTRITAQSLLKDPAEVRAEPCIKIPDAIEHIYFMCEQRDKLTLFRKIYSSLEPSRTIAFVRKGFSIDAMTEKLNFHGISTANICGKTFKDARKKTMDAFKSGEIRVLLATDIAARGLDIQDVTHIIHLDFPEHAEDYLHRVGRTGRNGRSGLAIALVTERELAIVKAHEKKLNILIHPKKMLRGSVVSDDN